MNQKPGHKTSEFWGKIVVQLLTLFVTFFPESELDPNIGLTIVGVLEALYNAGRVVVKRKEIEVEEKKIDAQIKTTAVSNALAGSKAFKFVAISLLAAMLFAACAKKPIDEGTVYNYLKGVSAGYNFAHEAITKFAAIMSKQIELACPTDPNGPLCKTGKAFEKLYTDTLYPGSVKATELWTDMMEAFDVYRQMESPTAEETQGMLSKIEAVEKAIDALKLLFAGVNVSAGPLSFDAVYALDYVKWEAHQIKLEVLTR